MKILWMTNTLLPSIAEDCNEIVTYGGGWLVGLSEALVCQPDVILAVCAPYNTNKIVQGSVGNISYYLFPCKNKCIYEKETERHLATIIEQFRPDVIHAFGTEYPTTYALMNVSPIDTTVISITGLIGKYAGHYYGGIIGKIRSKYYFRRFLSIFKKFSISSVELESMQYRAIYEQKALKIAKHIIGRTTWDKACVGQISDSTYHFCNETLRSSFYQGKWEYSNCDKHSIFIVNGGYPIKGLHIMLEALPLILQQYPDTKLYIAGTNILTRESTIKQRLLHYICTYSGFLYKKIKQLNIEDSIIFTGLLDEAAMKERYLKSNVFVLPSIIENSPNSLGEAMILALPCVSSCVGGVQDMMVDKEEGFLYPFDEPYMLAYYVCQLFKDSIMATDMGLRARKHAMETHNPDKNNQTLMSIYSQLYTPFTNSHDVKPVSQ